MTGLTQAEFGLAMIIAGFALLFVRNWKSIMITFFIAWAAINVFAVLVGYGMRRHGDD